MAASSRRDQNESSSNVTIDALHVESFGLTFLIYFDPRRKLATASNKHHQQPTWMC